MHKWKQLVKAASCVWVRFYALKRAPRRGGAGMVRQELALERYEMQLEHPAATTNESAIELRSCPGRMNFGAAGLCFEI